jgi:hypothetical protein
VSGRRELGSFYSAVIDVDSARLKYVWDVLIMDNNFSAQTILSESDWDPIRGVATGNNDRLNEYRSYFHTLLSAVDKRYVQTMSVAEVKGTFEKHFPFLATAKDPVEALFNYLMEQVAVP